MYLYVTVHFSRTSYRIQQIFGSEPPGLFYKKPCVLITFDRAVLLGCPWVSFDLTAAGRSLCKETVFEEMLILLSYAHWRTV
jgi:hypothetical protein